MQLTSTKLLSAVSLLSTSPIVMFCPGLFHMLSSDLIEPNSLSKTKPNLRNSGFCPNIGWSIPKKVWEILQCEKNSRKVKKEKKEFQFSLCNATILCRLFHWSNIQMLYWKVGYSTQNLWQNTHLCSYKVYLQILPSVQSCLISIKEDTTFVTYMSTRAIWSKLLSLESTPSQTVAFSQVQSGSRTNCGGWAMMYCMSSLSRLDRYSNTDMFTGAVLFSWEKKHEEK